MSKLFKLKKKAELSFLRRSIKDNRVIKTKLSELAKRENQYLVSSERLLKTSRDARKIHHGIRGYEMHERSSWASNAMYLRHFSEESLKALRVELISWRKEDQRVFTSIINSRHKINKLDALQRKIQRAKDIRSEIRELDDFPSLNLIKQER